MAGLRLEHIYKVYPNGTKAVSDFTMDIKDKEFIVFVGPSGCGKSTTLRMIAGLEEISAGELYIDNHIVNDVEPKDRDIAMVFQNYALYPHMTVYENIAFGLKLRHLPNEEIHKKVLWAAQVLDLTEYLDRKPRAMSGGQRQRVSLGRAIIRNPKVMLLDEPLSNLDAKLRAQMRSEIAKLHEDLQTTFIYVTHDQVEAMTLGTRVVVMKLGKIMQVDTPKNLYDYPDNLFVAGFIGTPQMNFFKAYLSRNGETDKIKLLNASSTLEVQHSYLSRIKPKYFDSDNEVTLGFRCEHISLEKDVVESSEHLIDVKISHFEELGNETLIYAELLNNETKAKPTNVIIKGTSTYGLKRGDIVKAALNLNKAHFFDSVTEQTINPRIPTTNLAYGKVVNNSLQLHDLNIDLPAAIKLVDNDYSVIIPVEAIKLNNSNGVKVTIDKVEEVENHKIVSIKLGDNLLFAFAKDDVNLDEECYIELDYTKLEFYIGSKLVHKAIADYDSVNAMFLNHITAKEYVGDKYDPVVTARVEEVETKYQGLFKEVDENYAKALEEVKNVDSKAVIEKNKPLIKEKTASTNNFISEEKNKLKEALKSLEDAHKVNVLSIAKEVNEAYDSVYNDEIESFNTFKQINKDRDAYSKRVQELKQFKANHKLEKENELNKRLNAEAINYETEVNALKGNFKREKENALNELKKFKNDCYNEAYPVKMLDKEYKNTVLALRKEYGEALMHAKIIFFFKTGNLATLCNDEISNKMIQSLGIKVFSKQYLVEIPHDAYQLSDEGFKVQVLEILDYGKVKYAKCLYKDHHYETNIYIQIEDENIGSELCVKYDISRIHITEKAMDIKIY
ncbi:MAG: sn-glycerol-3-phosphate ABC transporter ATP-binding protein UgpC [Bacilli bacterium]|nr:sn-glycerol-3-phosphate ABC transporter ATP-binding protein UgpC [Bacilli bacterium]